jgi:hypothetical protein
MKFIGLFATIITIVTGAWFLFDKFRNIKLKKQYASIDSIIFERTPLFKTNETLILGKNTVLIGTNGVGKTAICEWLSALENIHNLKRWIEYQKSHPIIISINFRKKHKHVLRLEITKDNLLYNMDGINVPANPLPVKFVFVYNKNFRKDCLDDGEIISRYLAVENSILKNYAERVGKSFYCSINDINFRSENKRTEVYVSLNEHSEPTKFSMLSIGEQGRVIIELAVAIAQFLSSETHVILVVERSSFQLDKKRTQQYVDWILKSNFNFQTIFTSVRYSDDVNWKQFKVVELEQIKRQ